MTGGNGRGATLEDLGADVSLVAILIHNVVEPLSARLSKAELPA